MDLFSDKIKIRLINEKTATPISNLALRIRLFSNSKNDYFLTYISDENGEIIINKSDLQYEIDKYRNLFPMDYSSALEDCKSQIEIVLMNVNEVSNSISIMKNWKSILDIQDSYILKLENTENEHYVPFNQIIKLNGQVIIQVSIVIKPHK